MKHIKLIILLLAIGILAGCASLQNAGTAEYSVKPFVDTKTGDTTCCEVLVKNGKEIAGVKALIQKQGESYTVYLEETGVKAFEGQAISAGAMKTAVEAAARAAAAAVLGATAPALLPAGAAALALPGLGAP